MKAEVEHAVTHFGRQEREHLFDDGCARNHDGHGRFPSTILRQMRTPSMASFVQ